MRKEGITFVLLCLVLCGSGLARDFAVRVGEIKTVSVPGYSFPGRVRGDYSDYFTLSSLRDNTMDIKGLRAGRASFTVSTSHGPRTYVVEVSDARVPISPQEIRTLLADLQDITVTPVGDKLIVSGRIMSSKERVRLDRVLKMYEGMVEDMTTGTEVMVDVAMTLIEVKTEKGSGVGFLDIIPTANVDYTNITDQGEGGRLIGEFSDGRLGFSVSA
ncbi:MAG TPA: hypothetical protein ENN51_01805, partial [candidate division WOR-3 bacterium]|nr:hypothetical protein [candidate division WOR-3 bacterium]